MTIHNNSNDNIQIDRTESNIDIDIENDNAGQVRNPEIGHPRTSDKLRLVGRIFLGILTLGISEGIRAIVNAFHARIPAHPRYEENIHNDDSRDSEDSVSSDSDSDMDDSEIIVSNRFIGRSNNIVNEEVQINTSININNNINEPININPPKGTTLDENLPNDQDLEGGTQQLGTNWNTNLIKLNMKSALSLSTTTFPNRTYREALGNKIDEMSESDISSIAASRTLAEGIKHKLLQEYDNVRNECIIQGVRNDLQNDAILQRMLREAGVPENRQNDYMNLIRNDFDNEGRFKLLQTLGQRINDNNGGNFLTPPLTKNRLESDELPHQLAQKLFDYLFERAQETINGIPKVKKGAEKSTNKATVSDTLFKNDTISVPSAGKTILKQSENSNTGFIMSVLNAMLWNKDGVKHLKEWFKNHVPGHLEPLPGLNSFESYMVHFYKEGGGINLKLPEDERGSGREHIEYDPRNLGGNAGEVLSMLNLNIPNFDIGYLSSYQPQMLQSTATEIETHAFWAQTTQNINNNQMAVILDSASKHYLTIIGTKKEGDVELFTVLDSKTGTAQNKTYAQLVPQRLDEKTKEYKTNAAFVTFFTVAEE